MKPRLTVAAVIALAVAVYLLRLDDVAGLINDDAWYVVLAKALASGQGFRLISSSGAQILPTVPPGYPAMLAPIVFLAPSFPANIVFLKSVSIIAMAVAAVAAYVDFRQHRAVSKDAALVLATIFVLTPALVFLATSTTMAECVFVAAQLLGTLAIERAVRTERFTTGLLAGLVVAAACLIRTAGVALAIAGVAYFVTRARYRQAAAFGVALLAAILPWQVYAFTHQPTLEEQTAHGGTIAYSYSQLIAMTRPGSGQQISVADAFSRAADKVRGAVMRDVGATILPVLYRSGNESGEEVVSVGDPATSSMGNATGTLVVSSMLALAVLVGIIRARAGLSLPVLLIVASLAMLSATGSQTFRYVLPLVPFFLAFLWHAVRDTPAVRIALMCLLGLHSVDHGEYLYARWTGTADWLSDAHEVNQVMSWLETSGEAGTVASTNPGLVFLRTGRKGIYLLEPNARDVRLRSSGVRYLAALRPMAEPGMSEGTRLMFRTGRRDLWVIEIPRGQTVHLTQSATSR